MFNYSENLLRDRKAYNTAIEIAQQPKVWGETFLLASQKNNQVKEFFTNLLKLHSSIRVILTGAGTSDYVGDTLVPILRKESPYHQFYFEAVASTDIVSDPESFLNKAIPTLIVSFARSGNSPESVAVVEIANNLIDQCYFLTITCNSNGDLAKKMTIDQRHLLFNLPPETNDKGFAMTSSFTSMLYAAYLFFVPQSFENLSVNQAFLKTANDFIPIIESALIQVEEQSFKRVIYLGSSAFKGLAQEAALKCLELNAGRLDTYSESSMGFRHGPKSLQTDGTLIILLSASEHYTQQYDQDIAKEISAEETDSRLIVLCSENDGNAFSFADQCVAYQTKDHFEEKEIYRCLLFALYMQMFALNHSLSLGIPSDNPSPDGKVNRVVQGVIIHSFNEGGQTRNEQS